MRPRFQSLCRDSIMPQLVKDCLGLNVDWGRVLPRRALQEGFLGACGFHVPVSV